MPSRPTSFFIAATMLFAAALSVPDKASADDQIAKLIKAAEDTATSFLTDKRWGIAQNALGGARGALIVPSINKGSFLFGYEAGVGLLMSRSGRNWSDPVIVKITNSSFGLQAGAQQSKMMLVFMADDDMDKIADMTIGLGTAGGVTLGNMGANVGAAASTDTGVNILFAAESDGVFAGGSFTNTAMSIDGKLNSQMYGKEGEEIIDILMRPASRQDTAALRELLSKAVDEAWRGTTWKN